MYPGAGHTPGVSGGVSAGTVNGVSRSTSSSIKDPIAAGDAWHTYEMNRPLKCYSYHWDKLYKLDDGKWCSSAYVCNHRGTPYVKPNPVNPPAPPAPPAPKPVCDAL